MTNSKAHLKWAAITYIIALHLFSAVLIVKTDFVPKVKVRLGIVAATSNPNVSTKVRYHQRTDDLVPDNATIFLGDSIVSGLVTAAIAPYSINYGIDGENSAQLLDAIQSYKSLARARAIVLAIGINDLGQGMIAGLNGRYQKVAEALPPKTPLIWSSVMPAQSKWIALSDISEANQTIKALCKRRGNCIYVDTWAFLADKNGEMINRLFLDDGVHLSRDGYMLWIAALREAMRMIPQRSVSRLEDEFRESAAVGNGRI